MPAPFNPFRIDWNDFGRTVWDRMLDHVQRPTLSQCRAYAMASAGTEGWRADFGLIRFDGRPVGVAMVQHRRLAGLFTSCRLVRGPLWIHDEIPAEMQKLVLGMLRRRYSPWRGRFLDFVPELEDGESHRAQLRATGFTRRRDGYQTIWLDLAPPADQLRAGLSQGWRHSLGQGERAGLQVQADEEGRHLDWLLDVYADDRSRRGYPGPSPGFLRLLQEHGRERRTVLVLRALDGREPVAGVLLARHGRAATYLVGWSGEAGRRARAHHLLLWRAALRLKDEGGMWLDLGGLNDRDAAGVAFFKRGLGGREIRLVGSYA